MIYDTMPDGDLPGTFLCAGHSIDRKTLRCVKTPASLGRICHRHVDDILADWPYVKVTDLHIACYGTLSVPEKEQGDQAYALRCAAFKMAMVK